MVHFREEQRFRQWWLWLILLVPMLSAWLAGSARGRLWGLAPFALLAWFWFLRLITEVHDDSVQVQFIPMWRKRVIGCREIRSAQARTYSPIREYGGWGLRWGPGRMAYNVSGDRGVLLELADGKSVMIVSQRPEELEAAIRTRLAR